MDTTHKYRAVARWTAGQTGLAQTDSAPFTIRFCAPPQFGGLEGYWTPEDLLLAALASCFATTFRAIAGYSKFDYTDFEVEVEGNVSKTEAGYGFSGIIFRPTLTIQDEAMRERALNLLQKAKTSCLISRALAAVPGLEARVEVGQALAVPEPQHADLES